MSIEAFEVLVWMMPTILFPMVPIAIWRSSGVWVDTLIRVSGLLSIDAAF